MINIKNMTDEEILANLPEITFQNIIDMRQPQLMRIMYGEKAVDIIPQCNQRRILRRDGILKQVYLHGGKTLIVTHKAQALLEEML